MNSNSTNRRIANGLQKFAEPIPLAPPVVTSPTCSVNIKDAKRPKVVVSITARIVAAHDRYGKAILPTLGVFARSNRLRCEKASVEFLFQS